MISIVLRYSNYGYSDYEVEIAADGRMALAAAASFRPGLIVLDVMLPDLDGFEVARRLRERADDTPILFLTARDTTEDKVRGLTLGGGDYVTKPPSPPRGAPGRRPARGRICLSCAEAGGLRGSADLCAARRSIRSFGGGCEEEGLRSDGRSCG